jgi:hypothetical protein
MEERRKRMEGRRTEISRKMWGLIILASLVMGAGAAAGIGAVQLYKAAEAKQLQNNPKQPPAK